MNVVETGFENHVITGLLLVTINVSPFVGLLAESSSSKIHWIVYT